MLHVVLHVDVNLLITSFVARSINRDKKGYNKGDGALIVGAFFRKYARESVLAKISLGTFPNINIAPKNKNKKAAVDFVKSSRQFFHHEMVKCFDEFNRSIGKMITLQTGRKMTFSKAIILAIYGDFPAASKCTVTGSACPQCFRMQKDFAIPPTDGLFTLRTPPEVEARRNILTRIGVNNPKAAKKKAKLLGISMQLRSGWEVQDDQHGFTPFGPNTEKDNVYQNTPQLMLHGQDEGITMKICVGIVKATIAEGSLKPNHNVTSASYAIIVHFKYIIYDAITVH